MKDVLKSLVGRSVHIHTTRSNESLYGELREVGDEVAIVVWGEHTYYIRIDQVVWFQEWPNDASGPYTGGFH